MSSYYFTELLPANFNRTEVINHSLDRYGNLDRGWWSDIWNKASKYKFGIYNIRAQLFLKISNPLMSTIIVQ